MIRTPNFLFLLAGGVLALALAAPLSAEVGLGAGDAAIDFEGKDVETGRKYRDTKAGKKAAELIKQYEAAK